MRSAILCALLAFASCVPPDAPACPNLDLAQPVLPDLAQSVPDWTKIPCGDETDCPREPEVLFCASDQPLASCAHPQKCGFCRRPL